MEESRKCALCDDDVVIKKGLDSLLCKEHDDARLTAASLDRIWSGEGLTYLNAERWSQKNYIAMVREAEVK